MSGQCSHGCSVSASCFCSRRHRLSRPSVSNVTCPEELGKAISGGEGSISFNALIAADSFQLSGPNSIGRSLCSFLFNGTDNHEKFGTNCWNTSPRFKMDLIPVMSVGSCSLRIASVV